MTVSRDIQSIDPWVLCASCKMIREQLHVRLFEQE
jgi:hypothetical protein